MCLKYFVCGGIFVKKFIILFLTLLLVLSILAYKKESDIEHYFEPNVSIIEGTLITRMYYGPPNYGENPDTDAKQYPFILQLDDPIDVIAQEGDTHNSNIFEVTEIQVVPKIGRAWCRERV